MTVLTRFVTEIEVGPDGELRPRPGGTWRSEPARGEAAIHRRLAALAGAPASRIMAFASRYGLLRLGAARAYAGPESAVRGVTIAMSHKLLDDVSAVRDWLDSGDLGPPPDAVSAFLSVADTFDALPASTREAMRLLTAGATTNEIEAVLGPAGVDPAAYLGTMIETAEASRARPFDPARDPEKLARMVEIFEWIGRLAAGLDESPAELAAMGGPAEVVRSLFVTLPEALAHPELADERNMQGALTMAELARESVADWQATAELICSWIGAVDLVRRALTEGLTRDEKEDLIALYRQVTGDDPSTTLKGAEIAERALPLLVAMIEGELQRGGAWPIRRGATLGLYWRALVALRTELTEQSPMIGCATVGCSGAFPPARNRRFCDTCQAERGREAVVRTRKRKEGGSVAVRLSPQGDGSAE